jgi:hypothetical protein
MNKPAFLSRFFVGGYNFRMPKKILISLIVLLTLITLLLLTLVKGQAELVKVDFSLPSGKTGSIVIEQYHRLWAGDQYPISAHVETADSVQYSAPVILVAKLESSAEEVPPRGELRVKFDLNEPVSFTWHICTARSAVYPGTLWLWVETESGKELLLARDLKFDAHDFLGLRISTLRIALGLFIAVNLLVVIYSLVMYKKGNQN